MRSQLDNIQIENEDGTVEDLKKRHDENTGIKLVEVMNSKEPSGNRFLI